ncbi:MAG: ribosome biogenesis GTPase Der [Candidatus Saccharibacteria bacterium]|nr:ribosome biogenesis GTPase Der [Candidatus Saccharibacteria bacterium]
MSSKKLPIVAIVGRANVGKSSLFNAILSRREAIVAREAGTTRDAVWAKATVLGQAKSSAHLDGAHGSDEQRTEPYKSYGEGAVEPVTQRSAKKGGGVSGSARKQTTLVRQDFWLADTAGIKDPEDDFEFTIQEQITQAAESADVIWVVVEADVAINEEDRRVAKMALKSKKPVFLVVNKIDKAKKASSKDYQRLGIKQIFLTSTTQNRGIGDLLDELIQEIPNISLPEPDERLRIALLGRPNVGKSRLFNTLAKKQQAIVADRAGTTRDINRAIVRYQGKEIELMDTAGIRRNGKIEKGIERFSVIRSLSAIEQADICLLLLDANELHVTLDQKIAGMVKESGKGLILVVSKWDSLDKDAYTRDSVAPRIVHDFDFTPWAPLVFTSAVTGQNVTKLFDMALHIEKQRQIIIKTTELNRWLGDITNSHPPAGLKNRQPKLNYIVQEADNPTNFKVFGAHTKFLHWSYKRFMDKSLREKYGFEGTPVKFWFFEKHETHKHGASPTKERNKENRRRERKNS